MTIITLKDYWNGNDLKYPRELRPEIVQEATELVVRVNKLLAELERAGVRLERHPRTKTVLSSGWRPPEVNADTPGAAMRSNHLWGRAADLYDPEGEIDDFLMTDEGQRILATIGLWMEHPAATKGWSHVQTRPPRSGRRVFYP